MKYLQTFNESIYGDVRRVSKKNAKNDEKFYELFKEIVEDFDKYGRDLRKVSLRSDGKEIIKDGRISIGTSGALTYLFGKYHPIRNNIHTGNVGERKRTVSVTYIPTEFVYKKNSLEKMFNTGRFNLPYARVKDERIDPNPEYNPNVSRNLGMNEPTEKDREAMRSHVTTVDEYKVSPDVAVDLYKYFLDEYNAQYPELSDSSYKGPMSIDDIRKGVSPIVKYISVNSKDGKSLTYGLRRGENEKEVRDKLSKMTEAEYDEYWKERRRNLYKDYHEGVDKRKKEKEAYVKELLKKSGFEPIVTKWEPDGFSISYTDYQYRVQLMTHGNCEEEEKKVEKMKENTTDDFELTEHRVSPGMDDDNRCFISLLFEKE